MAPLAELASVIAFAAAAGIRFSVPMLVWLALMRSGVTPVSSEWKDFLSSDTFFIGVIAATAVELALETAHLDRPLARFLGIFKVLVNTLFISATTIHLHPLVRLLTGFFASSFIVVPLHLHRIGFHPIACPSRRAAIAIGETLASYCLSHISFAFPFASAVLAVMMRLAVSLLKPRSPQPVSIHPHRHKTEERFLWLVTAIALVIFVLSPLLFNLRPSPRWVLPKEPSSSVKATVQSHFTRIKRGLNSSPIASFDTFVRLTSQRLLGRKRKQPIRQNFHKEKRTDKLGGEG